MLENQAWLWILFSCALRAALLWNPPSHKRHLNGRLSVWMFMCTRCVSRRANDRPQTLQSYALTSLCVCMWSLHPPWVLNALPHLEQRNFRTSLCLRSLCLFNSVLLVNRMGHSSHSWGFTPRWTRMWVFLWALLKNRILQDSIKQGNGLMPSW